jgi:hypothetical protein
MDTLAGGWGFDVTIDPALLTLAEISSSEECTTPHQDLTISNPTSPMGTPAGDLVGYPRIDSALPTQHYASSTISTYDAPMQQP